MAGISERTLYGYMQDAEFMQRYKEAFAQLVQNATRQAQQGITPAIFTLTEIMKDKTVQPSVRVTASRSILEYAMKLMEESDVLERLDKLEKETYQYGD